MLPSENRIKKQKEFDKVYKFNKKIRSDNFVLLVHFVDEDQKVEGKRYPRFGFVVSKKVGSAVERNKIKRRLREIVREVCPNLNKNFEAVIVAYPQIVDIEFSALREELMNLFETNNLVVKSSLA